MIHALCPVLPLSTHPHTERPRRRRGALSWSPSDGGKGSRHERAQSLSPPSPWATPHSRVRHSVRPVPGRAALHTPELFKWHGIPSFTQGDSALPSITPSIFQRAICYQTTLLSPGPFPFSLSHGELEGQHLPWLKLMPRPSVLAPQHSGVLFRDLAIEECAHIHSLQFRV